METNKLVVSSLEECERPSLEECAQPTLVELMPKEEEQTFLGTIKLLIGLAWPNVLARIFSYLLGTVSLIFAGHIASDSSADYVAGAALGSMFATVTGFSVVMGLVSAVETLCGQANGACNYAMVGTVLQRSMCYITVSLIPIIVVWLCTEIILLNLYQEPTVARLAGRYVTLLIPGLWPAAMYYCLIQYLQCQGIMRPELWVGAITLGIHILVNYLLIFVGHLGFDGPPIAYTISNWVTFILMVTIIKIRGYHTRTWFGWNWIEALRGWSQIARISVPGACMLCSEWWLFELLTLVAGVFGSVQLTAFALCLQVSSIQFMIVWGVATGVSVQVSNMLGAGLAAKAKFAAKCGMWFGMALLAIHITVIMLIRNHWGYLFTSQKEVIDLVGKSLPIICIWIIFDDNQGVMAGIIRGMGKQAYGAVVMVVAYWGICFPCSLSFAFRLNLKGAGLWWGIVVGLAFVFLGLGIIILRTDWEDEVKKAAIRINKNAEGRSLQESAQQSTQISLDLN